MRFVDFLTIHSFKTEVLFILITANLADRVMIQPKIGEEEMPILLVIEK